MVSKCLQLSVFVSMATVFRNQMVSKNQSLRGNVSAYSFPRNGPHVTVLFRKSVIVLWSISAISLGCYWGWQWKEKWRSRICSVSDAVLPDTAAGVPEQVQQQVWSWAQLRSSNSASLFCKLIHPRDCHAGYHSGDMSDLCPRGTNSNFKRFSDCLLWSSSVTSKIMREVR
jgi:hypothetical protein